MTSWEKKLCQTTGYVNRPIKDITHNWTYLFIFCSKITSHKISLGTFSKISSKLNIKN